MHAAEGFSIPFTPPSFLSPLAICFPGLPALQSEPVPWPLRMQSQLAQLPTPLSIKRLLLSGAKCYRIANSSWGYLQSRLCPPEGEAGQELDFCGK